METDNVFTMERAAEESDIKKLVTKEKTVNIVYPELNKNCSFFSVYLFDIVFISV